MHILFTIVSMLTINVHLRFFFKCFELTHLFSRNVTKVQSLVLKMMKILSH